MATFVESPIFTAGVLELLTDEQYAELQYFMLQNPEFGRDPGHGRPAQDPLEGRGQRQERRRQGDLLSRQQPPGNSACC